MAVISDDQRFGVRLQVSKAKAETLKIETLKQALNRATKITERGREEIQTHPRANHF
jgi:hypothetical protein